MTSATGVFSSPGKISGFSIILAFSYIALRRGMLNDTEFLFVAAYLALLLAYVWTTSSTRLKISTTTNKESFEEDGGDGNDDESKKQAQVPRPMGALSASLDILFEMPEKVKNKIVPELEKVASSFRGEDQRDGGGGDNDDRQFVRVDEKNMHLFPEERQEAEKASRSFRSTPTPALDGARRKYARIDHILCKIKQADADMYKRIMGLDWLSSVQ